ncbi:MAG TPA: choice-of-anchor tandem repeat GloVer-containing protein [Tepidisphaeraceae bacterium]|jgi:uncharacterized repeat protein (TIGR03803 family)|nr:choice-of-anchor tandem repeat GloVer-containing protein [Tepidisphaeraceae bacterium]
MSHPASFRRPCLWIQFLLCLLIALGLSVERTSAGSLGNGAAQRKAAAERAAAAAQKAANPPPPPVATPSNTDSSNNQPDHSTAAASGNFTPIYSFGSTAQDGKTPAVLAAAPDGTLFGATSGGGKYQVGVIFKCNADGTGYTILHQIIGGANDGAFPNSMYVGPDGALYGTFQVQGKSGHGAAYRCAADGSDFKIIHAFASNEGPVPAIRSIDPDGTLYCFSQGGAGISRMKPDGTDFTQVYNAWASTNRNKGVGPYCDGGDGYFYGGSARTLFKVKKDGTGYSTIYTFNGSPLDADSTDRAPILGSDNMLYGMSSNGGQKAGGVIFKIARDGSGYQVLLNPDAQPLSPRALAEGPDGKIYALVQDGVVSMNKDGSAYTVVHPMDGAAFPWTMVIHGGSLYAATTSGGKGGGTIFCCHIPAGS